MGSVDTFYILDLDRCLFDSSRFQDEFIRCVVDNHHALAREQIQDTQRATEASGGSFDTVGYVRSFFGQNEWQELKKLFLKEMSVPEKREALYFGDAKVFLAKLRHRGLPFGIMTYGGQEWQYMKLQALALDDVPHIITDTKRKGAIIVSYYDNDEGLFTIPTPLAAEPLHAKSVCLVDDKAVSFEGLPEKAHGYWLVPDESRLITSQQGEVGQNIKKIASLGEIVLKQNATK